MIFVTLGSQKFQFNRLLKEIDDLVENALIKEKIFAQIGYSDYKPKNYGFKQFLDRDEFNSIMLNCNVLITHGGTGAIINGVKREKKVIAVPREKKFGEHVDDHQKEIVEIFASQNLIVALDNMKDMEKVLNSIRDKKFSKYISNTDNIISIISNFIDNI